MAADIDLRLFFDTSFAQEHYVKCNQGQWDHYPHSKCHLLTLKPLFVELPNPDKDNEIGFLEQYNYWFENVDGQFFKYLSFDKPSNKNSYGKSKINFLNNANWFTHPFQVLSCSRDKLYYRIGTVDDGAFYAPYMSLQISGTSQTPTFPKVCFEIVVYK